MKSKKAKEQYNATNTFHPLKNKLKGADNNNDLAENIVNTVREPLVVLDQDLKVVAASSLFYEVFKVNQEETLGTLLYDIGNRQWNIPKLKELLETILPEKASFENYEVEHDFSTIGKRIMLLNARQIKRAFGKEKIILLAIEDITERRLAEKSLSEKNRITNDYLNILLDHVHVPIIIWDSSLIIKRFNHEFEKLSGYKLTEIQNKNIEILFPKNRIAKLLESIKNNMNDEESGIIEIDILSKNKDIKTVLWNSANVFDKAGNKSVATIAQDITNCKRSEDMLSISEIRYRHLFESAKDGIIVINAKTGKIVDVNPFIVRLFGYSKKIFIGKKIWEIGFFKDIAANKDKFLELQKTEYVHFDNLILESAKGQKINVEFISNSYSVNNTKIILCNIRDITRRIQSEKKHSLASAILLILNRQNEWTRLVSEILEEIKKYAGFEVAAIRIKEGENYSFINAIGFPSHFIKKEALLTEEDVNEKTMFHSDGMEKLKCLCDNIISENTDPSLPFFTKSGSFWTNSASKLLASNLNEGQQINTCKHCNPGEYESVAIIPIHSGEKIIGLLQLNDKRANRVTLELIQSLEKIVATIGIGFKKMTIEKRIKESEERFRAMFTQAPIGIALINSLTGRFLEVNPHFLEITGRTREEMTNTDWLHITHPDDIQKDLDNMALFNAGKITGFRMKKRYIRPDGTLVWISLTVAEIKLADKKNPFHLSMIEDITERKQTEEALQISEKRYNAIFNTSLELIYIYDLHGHLIEINQQSLNLFGYTSEEAKNLNIFSILNPDDLPKARKNIEYVLTNGVNKELQINNFKTKTGEDIFVETAGVRLDRNGKPYGIMGIARDITKRKLAEKELLFKNTILSTQQETSIDGILIVNERGKIISYNQRFIEIWDIPQNLIDSKIDEKILEFVTNKVADSKSFYNRIKYLYDYKDETSRDEIVLKNGVILDRYSAPMFGSDKLYYGRIWYFRDITESKKMETALRKSESQFRKLITALPDGVLLVNSAGKITYCNEQASKMFGYNSDELINSTIEDLLPERFSKVHEVLRNKYYLHPICRPMGVCKELFARHKDSSEFPVEIMLDSVVIHDELLIIAVVRDVTANKLAKEELIKAKEKAEEMNRLKTSFLANMSHELRTPLIGILGYAEFLENELKDNDLIEMVHTIKTSGKRLNTTLNNILDISKIEAEKLHIDIKEQDVIKYLIQQIKLFKASAEEKDLSLDFETKEEKLNAFIDEEMFVSIISNLLNNAIKFTQKGKVTLRAMKQGNNAVIEVEDTGIGVPEDFQKIIFEPFRQASEGHSRIFEGTGLGLTIVKKYMSIMGGTVNLNSRPENINAGIESGSTFILKFPLTGHIVQNSITTHWA